MRRLAPAWLVLIFGCGNCEIGADPIPGGFDPGARIDRAAQVRLTNAGIGALQTAVEGWVKDAAELACGGDLDCPIALGSSCVDSACTAGSFFPIDLPASVAGNLDLCTAGPCRVFASIEAVALQQSPPSSLIATITGRFASTEIPIHDRNTNADCVAFLDGQGPAPVTIELVAAPSSTGQIALTVAGVTLPPLAISGSCSGVGVALDAAIESASLPAIRRIAAAAVGQRCDVSADCPAASTCEEERCFEGQALLLLGFDEEQRITVPPLLESYDTPDAVSDVALQVGGTLSIDPSGVTAGVRAGMELVTPNPQCAVVQASPRTRPGFSAPSPLPATDAADLDFDGLEETPYQVALALSKAFLDQAVWSAYGGGLICGAIGTDDADGLHTGTLEIIIPSVRFLTKSHLYPRSERPVRISAWLRQEPEIQIGTGESHVNGGTTEYVDPLMHVLLRDFEINVSTLVEERWVRILTATLDLHLGVAVMVTPDNQVEPIIGVGVPQIISNVRITNHELLQEQPSSIAQALPTLLSFALLEFAGSAGQIPIPTLEGVDLDVLGIRGLGDQVAIYADLMVTGGNLSAAADTEARLIEVRTPPTEAFAVGANGANSANGTNGALELPEVEIALDGKGTGALEWQSRLDGGFWSTFTTERSITVSRPELALQGAHRLEVRSRVKGDYRSLDPTPAAIDFWIDSEPPLLELHGRQLFAFDRVSRDRITVEVIDADGARPLALDAEGHANVPDGVLRVRATDRAQLRSELVLEEAPAPESEAAGGCTATEGRGSPLGLVLAAGLALLLLRRRS